MKKYVYADLFLIKPKLIKINSFLKIFKITDFFHKI